MVLIKENLIKKRKVFLTQNSYRKVWLYRDIDWLENHISLLEKINPGYVLNHGYDKNNMWLDVAILSGESANKFHQTKEFVDTIVKFCKKNYKETYPYAHGDWALSNILIDQTSIKMCDWDNLGIYDQNQVWAKMHEDLRSAFRVDIKNYFYDTSII